MYIKKFCFVALLSLFVVPVAAQDDEARAASGLPQMIGRRPCSNPAIGSDATLSGSVNIIGMPDGAKMPVLSVTVLSNGSLVQRERVKNGGSFYFACIPRYGVSLIVEADGLELGSYPLTINPPPLNNRHEVTLMWAQLGGLVEKQKTVDSVRNSYVRTPENQKAFEKAVASLKGKNPDDSIKLFKGITEKDSNDYVAWTELGNLYFSGNKTSEAESAYTKALELKADFQPALMNFGKFLVGQKKGDPAVAVLTKAASNEPESADANYYLGEAYLLARKGSAAVGYLEKAIQLDPIGKAEVHLRLGALYNAAGVKDRAVAEYKKFLEKVPNHPNKEKIEKYISENTPK